MKDKTTEELKKLLADMNTPGAWDYDPDVAYTKACYCNQIREELERRKREENNVK